MRERRHLKPSSIRRSVAACTKINVANLFPLLVCSAAHKKGLSKAYSVSSKPIIISLLGSEKKFDCSTKSFCVTR